MFFYCYPSIDIWLSGWGSCPIYPDSWELYCMYKFKFKTRLKIKFKNGPFLDPTKQFKCIPRTRNQCCGWVEGERSNYVGLVLFDVNHPTRIYCVCIYVRAWSIFYIHILLTESTNLIIPFQTLVYEGNQIFLHDKCFNGIHNFNLSLQNTAWQ